MQIPSRFFMSIFFMVADWQLLFNHLWLQPIIAEVIQLEWILSKCKLTRWKNIQQSDRRSSSSERCEKIWHKNEQQKQLAKRDVDTSISLTHIPPRLCQMNERANENFSHHCQFDFCFIVALYCLHFDSCSPMLVECNCWLQDRSRWHEQPMTSMKWCLISPQTKEDIWIVVGGKLSF